MTYDRQLTGRYRPGDYESWESIAPVQKAAWSRRTFEYGTWGGEFRSEFAPQPGDIVAQEHWCASGFANTDLDLQLKRHGIHQLIVIGLIAHTCVEATVRFAAELGYDVTMVKDATTSYSDGRVEQSSFHNYRVLRMNESPPIEVHLVRNGEAPGGIGEPGTAVTAAALGNAVYAATGKRLRKLPLQPGLASSPR